MRQTKFFNIEVPELGDKPDISQVSNAIGSLEDALAGTIELFDATINANTLSLVSKSRTTKRTKYYDGLIVSFRAPSDIGIGAITNVVVDNLPAQHSSFSFFISQGDLVFIVYEGSSFNARYFTVPKSTSITSTSTITVATSSAVKTVNDKAVSLEGRMGTAETNITNLQSTTSGLSTNKADKTTQIIAGNGLTGGGDLSSNKTINIVSGNAGITVNADNIVLNTINAVNSTDTIKPASANSAKIAYDKGVEALNKANECPYRVGDILTTTLSTNPSTTWIGTTWSKIEGRYLKGTTGSEASKATGGSNTKTISTANMPAHNHSASASTEVAGKHTHTANHNHSGSVGAHTHTANHTHTASQAAHAHTQPTHSHVVVAGWGYSGNAAVPSFAHAEGSSKKQVTSNGAGGDNTGSATPAITVNTTNVTTSSTTPSLTVNSASVTTSEIADHSHTVSVSVANNGSGTALDIQPAYYTVHYWLRTA